MDSGQYPKGYVNKGRKDDARNKSLNGYAKDLNNKHVNRLETKLRSVEGPKIDPVPGERETTIP